jgi:uncharacterized protein (TIGR03435 family)
MDYIGFAYKITGNQVKFLRPQLPKWASTENFDIRAQAKGNPTKDQMRLMMQSLLSDRFKLAMHDQTLQLPVFGVVLAEPAKLGPDLQQHSENPPCPAASVPRSAMVGDRFPAVCGELQRLPASTAGRARLGARNVTMAQIASFLAGNGIFGDVDRPMVDQAGVSGSFDFSVEWAPTQNGAPMPGWLDESGPTFVDALRDQLGLKLELQMGMVDILVIDYVEEPLTN